MQISITVIYVMAWVLLISLWLTRRLMQRYPREGQLLIASIDYSYVTAIAALVISLCLVVVSVIYLLQGMYMRERLLAIAVLLVSGYILFTYVKEIVVLNSVGKRSIAYLLTQSLYSKVNAIVRESDFLQNSVFYAIAFQLLVNFLFAP